MTSSWLSALPGREQAATPPITTATASALLVLYTVVYVLPFYLSPKTRPSRSLSRDAPSVIRARITSVSVSCVICSVLTLVILTSSPVSTAATEDISYGEALHWMGWWPLGLLETAKALLLTAILFAGPLYKTLIVDGGWRDLMRLSLVHELRDEWTTWRNIVAGPVTEEVLFRAASVPLLLLAGTSVSRTVYLAPVIFGLAHLHHLYEFRVTHPHVPLSLSVVRSLVQFAYTSLFGAYATFLFLRTGSLLAICAVHAFCNCMGLPQFWGRVEPEPEDEDGDGRYHYNPSSQGQQGETRRPSVMWTVVYYLLLVAGLAGWWCKLSSLTDSANALAHMKV